MRSAHINYRVTRIIVARGPLCRWDTSQSQPVVSKVTNLRFHEDGGDLLGRRWIISFIKKKGATLRGVEQNCIGAAINPWALTTS